MKLEVTMKQSLSGLLGVGVSWSATVYATQGNRQLLLNALPYEQSQSKIFLTSIIVGLFNLSKTLFFLILLLLRYKIFWNSK